MEKNIAIAVLAVLVFVFGLLYLGALGRLSLAGFTEEVNPKYFKNTVDVASLSFDEKDTIGEFDCVSNASFNPASFSSSTVASTSVAVSGLALGDLVFANFATTTKAKEWIVSATVESAGTSTVFFTAVPSAEGAHAYNTALNLATGTLKVCYFGF